MDIGNHAAGGLVISYAIEETFSIKSLTIKWVIRVICFISGIAPDVIGFLEKIYYNDFALWNWYHQAHVEWMVPRILPPYLLHVWLDSFVHADNRWWIWGEGMLLYLFSWMVLLIILFFFFKKIYKEFSYLPEKE